MRYAVEYDTKGGRVGLIIFNVATPQDAQDYIDELINHHGHGHVWNLNELVEGTIDELYRLYPRVASVTSRGHR